MNKIKRLVLFVMLPLAQVHGQPAYRVLPAPPNHPMLNAWQPYISFDGAVILFLSDNTEGKIPRLFISTKAAGDWKDPAELPKGMNSNTNFRDGFSLSPDARTVYVSSSRPGTLGGDRKSTRLNSSHT